MHDGTTFTWVRIVLKLSVTLLYPATALTASTHTVSLDPQSLSRSSLSLSLDPHPHPTADGFKLSIWLPSVQIWNKMFTISFCKLVEASQRCNGKEFTCQYKRLRFDPWVRKMPWRRAGNPLQYSCLDNPMEGGDWQATLHWVAESDKTEWLSNWACTRTHTHTHIHTHTRIQASSSPPLE